MGLIPLPCLIIDTDSSFTRCHHSQTKSFPIKMHGGVPEVQQTCYPQLRSEKKKKKHKTEVMQYAVRFSLYAGNKTVRLGTQDWFQFLERRSLAYSHVFFCCLCLYKANHENSIKIIPDTRMNLLLKSKPYTEAWPFKNVLTRLLKTLSFFVSNRIYNVSMYNISTNSAGFFIFFF